MKKFVLAGAMILFCCPAFAVVTMYFEEGSSGTVLIFSERDNEVGRQIFDMSGTYLTTKGNIPDGTCIMYSKEKNTVKLEYTFKGGQKVAEKIFTDDGLLKYSAEYKDGLLDGKKMTYYFKDEKPMQIISYKKGKKDGESCAFFQNGNKEYEENYKEGLKQGKRKTYYAAGAVESEELYKDDSLDGPWKKYWENGKARGEVVYKMGVPVGSFKSYHENGKIETDANYKDGMLNGTMKVYDADGNVKSEEIYKNDKLVKRIK